MLAGPRGRAFVCSQCGQREGGSSERGTQEGTVIAPIPTVCLALRWQRSFHPPNASLLWAFKAPQTGK